nr:MAG: nonstructural protein [Microvirus sp.]
MRALKNYHSHYCTINVAGEATDKAKAKINISIVASPLPLPALYYKNKFTQSILKIKPKNLVSNYLKNHLPQKGKKTMILQQYSIYDEVIQSYYAPFQCINEKDAIRTLSQVLLDKKSKLFLSHQDYSLYHVGSFNDQDGQFSNITPPFLVTRCTQIVNSLSLINKLNDEHEG